MARTYHIYTPRRRSSLSVRLQLVPAADELEAELPSTERDVPTLQLGVMAPQEWASAAQTPPLPAEIEDEILAMLTAGPHPGETTSSRASAEARQRAPAPG